MTVLVTLVQATFVPVLQNAINFLAQIYLCIQNLFSRLEFFLDDIFWTNIIFWTKDFFGPKIFLGQQCFHPKLFLEKDILSKIISQFFSPGISLDPTSYWPGNYLQVNNFIYFKYCFTLNSFYQ